MEANGYAVAEFGATDLDSADEAEMVVVVNGKPTNWIWFFAGPGHPKTIEQNNRLSRERLHEQHQQEQARVNGRKWKGTEESPDEIRAKNVKWIVERLLRWSPVCFNGEELSFSAENATKLLMDPRKAALFQQAVDFLSEDASFTKRSASNSESLPGAPSN